MNEGELSNVETNKELQEKPATEEALRCSTCAQCGAVIWHYGERFVCWSCAERRVG